MFGQPKRAGVVAAALAIACALVGAQASPARANTQTIGQQLSAVALSTAGANAEAQFAKFATSSDVAAAAQFLLSTQSNNLTGFQKSLLSLVPYINANSQAIQDRAARKNLSVTERAGLLGLFFRFEGNPAIRVLDRTGDELKFSAPALAGTLRSDAAALSTPVTVIPPGSGIPQLDSFDNAAGNYATAANLPALVPTVTPIMQGKNFPAFVTQSSPLVAASLIPADQIWKLLLPNDHDPSTADYVDWIGGMLSVTILGIAGIISLPETATAAIILVTLGTLIGQGTLEFHFLATIDCDHDGDPWDPADVVGNEC
jgi:hypothetical protein